jgi:hypothetical protein
MSDDDRKHIPKSRSYSTESVMKANKKSGTDGLPCFTPNTLERHMT